MLLKFQLKIYLDCFIISILFVTMLRKILGDKKKIIVFDVIT